jgi:hypothetical protein
MLLFRLGFDDGDLGNRLIVTLNVGHGVIPFLKSGKRCGWYGRATLQAFRSNL